MADSDPEPEIPSDSSTPRNLAASLFNIPNFLAGFGSKISPDSDSIRSPTSPLEIGVFSNFRNPVSITKYARSSSEKGYRKEWNWNKVVGLGIVNSPADDSASQSLCSPNQKNVVFGPQVKSLHGSLDSSLRSKSLPMNYIASRLSRTKRLEENATAPLCFSDSNVPSSLAILAYDQISGPKTKPSSEEENSSELAKHSTVPIPIVGSLSAREIELSEDYTCIISHGPNPKTIHIFGDCVLERHANDLGQEEESRNGSPRVAKSFDGLDPVRPSDEVLTLCHACKRKFEGGDENLVYRGDKAFCSFDCCSGNFSEEETEMGSSFHEYLFLLGMSNAI